jgi:hypothetical protein
VIAKKIAHARTPGPAADPEDEAHPLRSPFRWPVVAGIVGLGLGGLVLPWATIIEPGELAGTTSRAVISGASGFGDGFSAFLVSLVLLGTVASRQASKSRIRTVQLAPAILGCGAFFLALSGVNGADEEIRHGLAAGWPVTVEPGLDLERAAAIVTLLGGMATTAVVALGHPLVADPTERHGFDRQFVALLAVGAAGVLVGFWAATVVAGFMGHDSNYATRLALLATIGVCLGPAVTVSSWRRWRRAARQGG